MCRAVRRLLLGMSAAAPQPPSRGAEKSNGGACLLEENHREPFLLPSGRVTEASRESGSAEGLQLQRQQEDNEDNDKWQRGRPQPCHVVEAPPPKENPWTRWKPPPNSGSSLSPSNASSGGELTSQDPGEKGRCRWRGRVAAAAAAALGGRSCQIE